MMKERAGSPSPLSLLSLRLDECREAMEREGDGHQSSPRRDAWNLAVCISQNCSDHSGALKRIETLIRHHLVHIFDLIVQLRAKGVPPRTIMDRVVLGEDVDISAYVGSPPSPPRASPPPRVPQGIRQLKARSKSFEMELARRRSRDDAESALAEIRAAAAQPAVRGRESASRTEPPFMFPIED